ncbi:hypothetical protein NMY22_g16335 [Coprinellus aureogranulatus]|nr:hypothetical protein NMY22_g16335 [Coprinellus aureogranulatus]
MLSKFTDLFRRRKRTTTSGEAFEGEGSRAVKEATPVICKGLSTQPIPPFPGATLREPLAGSSEVNSEHNPEDHRREPTEYPESDCSGADSLASIDTISDAGSAKGSDHDPERERNWRVRKILKYSRWKSQVDGATSGGAKRAKDIERRVAKQEQRLRDLEAAVQANRADLETVEEGSVKDNVSHKPKVQSSP